MSNDEKASYKLSQWCPGAIRKIVIATAEKLADYDIAIPPLTFYQALADRAEETANEAIAEAIAAKYDEGEVVLSNVRIARRLLHELDTDLFLATEQADDATLARLAAYLVFEGSDGYNDLNYHDAWGAHRDPDWGTIWSIRQDVRDFTPAFIFKICMKGDTRLLAVECHAPTRRLPEDLCARLRARTMIVSGVPVLAFSPAEVEADAAECVSDVGSALATLAQELLALHGIEPPPRRDFRPKGYP
jgi:hypothetical protein